MSDTPRPDDRGALSGWAKPDWASEPGPTEAASGWAPLGPAQADAPTPPTAAAAPPAPARVGGATAEVGPRPGTAPKPAGPAFGRRRLVVGVGAAVAVALVAFLLFGRGGGEAGQVKDRIAAALEARGLSGEDAGCVADRVVDEMGTDDLRQVEDFNAAEPPPGLSDDFPAAFGAALSNGIRGCDVTLPVD